MTLARLKPILIPHVVLAGSCLNLVKCYIMPNQLLQWWPSSKLPLYFDINYITNPASCKARRQYLLTCKVSRYYLMSLQGWIVVQLSSDVAILRLCLSVYLFARKLQLGTPQSHPSRMDFDAIQLRATNQASPCRDFVIKCRNWRIKPQLLTALLCQKAVTAHLKLSSYWLLVLHDNVRCYDRPMRRDPLHYKI